MTEQHQAAVNTLIAGVVSAGQAPDSESLMKVAQGLAKLFNVDPDEVALLQLDVKSRNLKFVMPEKLAVVGAIPLTSTGALAARTARERRAEIVNNFSAARHATVFEGVPLGRREGESIQKIMSAPILDGTQVRGVAQISRKGRSLSEAGVDFNQKDLRLLTSICPALCQFIKLFQTG